MPVRHFDPSSYAHAPSINLANGIALALALLKVAPPGKEIQARASALRKATVSAQNQWVKKKKAAKSDIDARAVDNAADVAWRAFHDRLAASTMLPHNIYPAAKAAATMYANLFGDDGLSFLTKAYPEQATHMAMMLGRVAKEGKPAVVKLVGADFVQEIQRVQAPYEKMVNVYYVDVPTEDSLLDALRVLASAIGAYSLQIAALADKDDAKSVKAALKALAPIDKHRDRTARGEEGPTVPPLTPPAPPAPAAPKG